MSRHLTRVVVFLIALLFVATAMVPLLQVWQNHQNSKAANQANQQGAQVNNQPKLQGTPLAGFTPVASIPQLQEVDLQQGTGPAVQPGATVTVDYTGAVASTGTIFQSSKDIGQAATFALKGGPNGVLEGWVQGVPGMKVGGTRRLLIPAALAYGSNPPPGSGIPANADLVFDVTLRSISK